MKGGWGWWNGVSMRRLQGDGLVAGGRRAHVRFGGGRGLREASVSCAVGGGVV